MAQMSYLEAIRDALLGEMRRDPRVFVLGEDIGVYGGAFGITKGFVEEFGPWRVIDAPLAEAANVGAGVGAAVMGMRPVVEMQFADFISDAFTQVVNVAAKFHWRTGTPLPMVLRMPYGGTSRAARSIPSAWRHGLSTRRASRSSRRRLPTMPRVS